MIKATHNNVHLESFIKRDLNYDYSSLDFACVGLTVHENLGQSLKSTETLFEKSLQQENATDLVVAKEIKNGDGEEPFYVGDMDVVVKQHEKWNMLLPRIKPFYAIKCNTEFPILNTLNQLGTGFDCASKGEIAIMLEMGVDPSRIIYANPCKPISHIKYAREKGVKRMTFDNLTELVKIKNHFPEAKLVLRIATDDSKSICRFSIKFGAAITTVESLLVAAKDMDLNVMGVSFHVGSGCCDAAQYLDAIKNARYVFDKAEEIGFEPLKLLDIGGGFPGSDEDEGVMVKFPEIAEVVNQAIDFYFPTIDFPYLEMIAEPGRYFASAAYVLAVSITSCRVVSEAESKKFMYYVNDGVYGSFNCILFDHAVVTPTVLTQHGQFVNDQIVSRQTVYKSSVWGPTCDSMDCILKEFRLPELDVGDWLLFRNMGAYTLAAASTFNGFPRSRLLYINEESWRNAVCSTA